ncbi:MAG TPA: ABC transporter permease [bacterium]|nr:ABC transporter permease [bacterium]
MNRRGYIVGRLGQMAVTFAVLAVLIFYMIRLIPGDPAITMLGIQATPDSVQELRHHLGLDRPVPVQFWIFVAGLAHGDLGQSVLVRAPVLDLVRQRLPLTLFLVTYAMILATLVTVPLGTVAALRKNSAVDQAIRGFSVFWISTPSFWVGILMLILFGVRLGWFPVGGGGQTFTGHVYYLFLPALTMGLGVSAVLTRNLRDAILSTLTAEHVVVARAKGLPGRRVVIRHVLRNAIISTITLLGLYIGFLVGGSVIIESVFALPGMGSEMVSAILGRDYQVVQGFTLVYAVLVSVVYLLTDITYALIDPRIAL